MKHILFYPNSNNKYKIALLIKEAAFATKMLEKHYVDPLIMNGMAPDSLLALSLDYTPKNKAPAAMMDTSIQNILKACAQLEVDTLLVADASYFKKLTKLPKAEPHFGYIKPCRIKGYEHINVILSANYQALFHNPAMKEKLDMSLNTLIGHITDTHVDLGLNIIQHEEYPASFDEIKNFLWRLHDYGMLACDIEATSLNWWETGIETISFAWNKHEGGAFRVDKGIGSFIREKIHKLLLEFFYEYKGTLIYHNGNYDIKIIIATLFMKHLQDIDGLIEGLKVMYRNVEDTKLITYLATNSTAGNNLGLKQNAFEFAGNYAQDEIEDTRQISVPDLLRYNLVDSLATWFVFDKNYPIMIQDQQEDIYRQIFLPSMKVITHMELIGMPMDYAMVKTAEKELGKIRYDNLNILLRSKIIKDFEWQLRRNSMIKANAKLKRKVKSIDEFNDEFNPASNPQLQKLLYDFLGMEVIDKTDSGAPACGGATLKKLLNKLKEEHNLTDEDLK